MKDRKMEKLNLGALKVKSFVTEIGHIKGGVIATRNCQWIISDDFETSIPTNQTPLLTSTSVSTPQLTETRQTFANPHGNCQTGTLGL